MDKKYFGYVKSFWGYLKKSNFKATLKANEMALWLLFAVVTGEDLGSLNTIAFKGRQKGMTTALKWSKQALKNDPKDPEEIVKRTRSWDHNEISQP